MPANAANTCARCLRARVDVTEGVPRHAAVVYCPACSSYLQPPRSWLRAAPESPELTQILLRRVHRQIARLGAAIAAAGFVFTEPHSKRLKLRLRLRREVLNGVTVEQAHVVEFAVHDRLCGACGKAQADPDQWWSAVVQVRQRASHRRTLLHLEQQLVRHGAASSALRVDGNAGGLDLYFASRSHAASLVDFVSSVAPARVGTAKQLVSHDTKSNSCSFKHTFSVELCPICRDDLIFLPREASRALGGLGPLVLCIKVTSSIALLDTNNMRVVVLSIKEYDRYKFEPLLTSRRLVEYVVLDVEHDPSGGVTVLGSPYMVSWAQVARVSDFGKNDTIFTVKTHLGYQLKPGDYAYGYDLYSVNSNNDELEKYGQSHKLPDAVLAKKSYKKSAAGKPQDETARDCIDIDEIAMGIGCIDLNPSDEKELDELIEDLTI
jgi:nonsense-mediated mRNA decay protein 3